MIFVCLPTVSANTTRVSSGAGEVVRVMEGGSVNISCTSTGVPTPTISWTLNNMAAPFNHTDSSTEFRAYSPSSQVAVITEGSVVSTLQLESPQYPAHEGVYVCEGSNTHAGSTSTSSVSISVLVLGRHQLL